LTFRARDRSLVFFFRGFFWIKDLFWIRGSFGILHIAGASRVSRYEPARMLADAFNPNSDLIEPAKMGEMKWRAKRPGDSSLNITKRSNTLMETKPPKA
jgi:dTDP-4-dehydrorhamnose reductase